MRGKDAFNRTQKSWKISHLAFKADRISVTPNAYKSNSLLVYFCITAAQGLFFFFFFRQSRRNFWKNGYWLSPWHVHVSHFKPKNFSNISFVVKIPQINCSVKKIWFHMLLWKMLCFYTWTYFQRLLTLYRAEESKKDSLWRGKLSSNKFIFSPLFLLIYKLKCIYVVISFYQIRVTLCDVWVLLISFW